MTIEIITKILGWSTLFNMGILTVWFGVIVFAHDWMYQLHGKWFRLSIESFNTIHYAGMAFYKISIFLFNLVPFLVILLVT